MLVQLCCFNGVLLALHAADGSESRQQSHSVHARTTFPAPTIYGPGRRAPHCPVRGSYYTHHSRFLPSVRSFAQRCIRWCNSLPQSRQTNTLLLLITNTHKGMNFQIALHQSICIIWNQLLQYSYRRKEKVKDLDAAIF
jgi:hypothetical protein